MLRNDEEMRQVVVPMTSNLGEWSQDSPYDNGCAHKSIDQLPLLNVYQHRALARNEIESTHMKQNVGGIHGLKC